jgi:hypothetical protein
MSSKLTLSVAPDVVAAAKRYAATHDTSVSQLVEDYLSVITRQASNTHAAPSTPMLTKLRGSLRGKGDVDDHRQHLAAKYK